VPCSAFRNGPKLTALPPEKLIAVLRDGKKLIGVLRSWDQYGKGLMKIGRIEAKDCQQTWFFRMSLSESLSANSLEIRNMVSTSFAERTSFFLAKLYDPQS